MKIAIVTETFPPEINGVAMTFGVIARELGRRGHAVTVYHPRRDDLPGGVPSPEFAEVPLPGVPIPGYGLLRFGLPAGGRFRKLWREDRPDLVHVATVWQQVLAEESDALGAEDLNTVKRSAV